VWEGVEEYARDDWRTPDELLAHLRSWLDRHDPNARAAIDNSAGRYLGFGHGGLLRMPLTGGWQSQGAAGYRAASILLGDRSAVFADPDGAVDATARRHLSAYGPASRHDIAWWSGLGLRVVDSALGRLAGELTEREGPDGRIYHDLLEAPAPADPPSLRLLPEFDALLCGYDPQGSRPVRQRGALPAAVVPEQRDAAGPAAVRRSAHRQLAADRLGDQTILRGRLVRRPRRPKKSELDGPLAALQAAYGITVTSVTISRET